MPVPLINVLDGLQISVQSSPVQKGAVKLVHVLRVELAHVHKVINVRDAIFVVCHGEEQGILTKIVQDRYVRSQILVHVPEHFASVVISVAADCEGDERKAHNVLRIDIDAPIFDEPSQQLRRAEERRAEERRARSEARSDELE